MEHPLNSLLRMIRLRAVWLLVLPFLYFAHATFASLAGGFGVAVMGLVMRGWAAGHIRKDEELATGGPYAHTRNPLYVGSFVTGVGVTIAGAQPIFLALFIVFFLVVYSAQSRVEQTYLTEKFGDTYVLYAKNVRLFWPMLKPDRTTMSRTRFQRARYFHNREWEATLGVLAAFGGLVAKWVLQNG